MEGRKKGKQRRIGGRKKNVLIAVENQLKENCCYFCKMQRSAANMSDEIFFEKVRHYCEFSQIIVLIYILTSL